MAQSPFLIDQIDIEPGSAGIRRISRDAGTGGLAFQDAIITSPLTLSQLAGLNAITNVLVVGKSGAGAAYTTIQSALDMVPSSASSANPYLILVLPGVYTETVNIVRDGVRLVGLGHPTIESALEATPDAPGAGHTVIISAQLGTIPLSTLIQGFTITNVHTNKACIRVIGAAASTVGSSGIVIKDCDLSADSAGGTRNIWATAVENLIVTGGQWGEAADLGLLLIQEAGNFRLSYVQGVGAIDLRFDTSNDVPFSGVGTYQITNCGAIAENTGLGTPFAVDLAGSGTLSVEGCSLPAVTLSGNQTFQFDNCLVAELLVTETVTCTARNTSIAAITAPAAGAVLDLPSQTGSAVFGAATTVAVAFDVPMSDAVYQVQLEVPSQPVNDETPWITSKLATGFTINFATNQTMTVEWLATRIA